MTNTTSSTREDFRAATAYELDLAHVERDRLQLGLDVASRTQEHLSTATAEGIRNFARGYGDDNPLFTDPEYGRSTRWGGQIAPGIMAQVLNAPLRGDPLPAEVKSQTRGLYKGIHAFVSGGTWDFYRPVRPGEMLHSFSGLESLEVKDSEFAGKSVIRVMRHVKMTQHAEVVAVYRELVIYTARKAARARGRDRAVELAQWDEESLRRLERIYEAEQRRGRTPLYWEDVTIGDQLPAMAKGPLTTRELLVFHAGGFGFTPYGLHSSRLDYENRQRIPAFYVKNEQGVPDVAQRVHWDADWARAVGAASAYDYGVLRECWVHHYVTDWAGDDAWITRQHDQIRKFNYHGDAQILSGLVTGKSDTGGRHTVDVEVVMTNQRDEQTVRAEVTVALPSRADGPVLLPAPPEDLQRAAVRFLTRHNELSATPTGAITRTGSANALGCA